MSEPATTTEEKRPLTEAGNVPAAAALSSLTCDQIKVLLRSRNMKARHRARACGR